MSMQSASGAQPPFATAHRLFAGTHTPAVHVAPVPQLLPHAPQFVADDITSTHPSLHASWSWAQLSSGGSMHPASSPMSVHAMTTIRVRTSSSLGQMARHSARRGRNKLVLL